MNKNRNYLIDKYNATSTDDGKGDIESYESWLEKQLLRRIKRVDALESMLQKRNNTIVNLRIELSELRSQVRKSNRWTL